jgi:hypothetical protein
LFAAMRRALVLAGVFVVSLLAAGPVGAAPSRDIKFELHEDGFLVTVKSEVGEEEKLVLSLWRHGEIAYYEVPAEITEDRVKARFGQLGELDYTFIPGERVGPCAEFAVGTYEGTFDFTGENEYVKFEVDRTRGTFLGLPTKGCKEPLRRRAKAAAAPSEPRAAEDEATLEAHTGHLLPIRFLLAFELDGKRPRAFFNALQAERTEGMLVERGAQMIGGPGAFRWNLKAGTAHIHPPAPFTGSATFERRSGGRSVWRGSLRAPLLGGEPFRLTGGDFQAQLIKGSPLD